MKAYHFWGGVFCGIMIAGQHPVIVVIGALGASVFALLLLRS